MTFVFYAATGVLAVVAASQLVPHAGQRIQQIYRIWATPVGTSEIVMPGPAWIASREAGAKTPSDDAAPVAISADAGEAVFRKCSACHTADQGGAHRTGPNLWNVVDRPVASVDGFEFSEPMAGLAGEAWSPALLDEFLANPRGLVPGTKMTYAGLSGAADRANLIAWLAQQSDTPRSPDDLGLAVAGAADAGAEAAPEAAPEIAPVPYPEGVTYRNPPGADAGERARIEEAVAALKSEAETLDYERARFHPIHFPPRIETASNAECLVCHKEVLENKVRESSPAGVEAQESLAWYQTLDTYTGPQATFHWRHLESDFAKEVMNLECTFCHRGNDPREETPDMVPTRAAFSAAPQPEFTLRKMVNPTDTCLRCHGAYPSPEEIMGLAGPWHEVREDFEFPETPNGCMTCHAELYRTNRHMVTYLNAETIEELAREGSSDTCYGCHGGRQWYSIAYPYPRSPWPMMPEGVPGWAEGRPTAPDARYALPEN
ncbi:c-type cytochrome [Rhodovulum imhoffii]|uniref:c-type cytochrome n=1 Tax=Rhodovulum imhoffii TaxID=365340 RepID=UPI001475601E|nr:cytochrome c family protein [Rhodovulum imhoffii]